MFAAEISSRYVHPSEDVILEAMSHVDIDSTRRLGGHNFGRDEKRALPLHQESAEVNQLEGEEWRELGDDFRTSLFANPERLFCASALPGHPT